VLSRGLALIVGLSAATLLPAQDFRLPEGKKPDDATLKAITDKTNQLGKAIQTLRRQAIGDPLLADLEVFHRAAVMIVKHNEFFQPTYGKWTVEVLERGLKRTKQTADRDLSWIKDVGKTTIRGYRSRLDGSVQPYAVTYPAGYGKEGKKWRVDVVLHGRDSNLTEVRFVHAHSGDKPAPAEQEFIRIDIYGRGNNAYRWAGEVDVFEAINNFIEVERLLQREKHLDTQRWVLRGFSMGGAGTWHLGLHRPDGWCVLGPGAGFTATHGYVGKLPAKLPPWQEVCLHIYDAVDYAENVANVPVVAYGGAKDPQLQAARNIEARLKGSNLAGRLQILVAPDLAHKFPPEWQKKAEDAYAQHIAQGREEYPKRVRFVTWTTRYPSCDWVRILGLQRHYEKAVVDAEKTEDGFKVTTANVRNLRLGVPAGLLHDVTVEIDGQKVLARPWGAKGLAGGVYLQRKDGRWGAVLPQRLLTDRQRQPQKVTGLQGPIDDAFTEAFLCVRGTGKPWHEAVQRHADDSLQRFRQEWSKYWRGDLPIKDDSDVTYEDIAERHLILFGDPSSNTLLAQVLDALPLRWTKDKVTLAGKEYAASEHVPVLIYPSPLNPARYVVLNTGHTFPTADYEKTNALLYPRLGDYAVLRLAAGTPAVAAAGLFDEYWQIPKGKR